jgi:tetratricopeptide (TPR) repeat protein/serine/threonine protein kinase
MTALEDQARSLFLAALERPPDRWPEFLDAACGGAADVRARVEQLLHAHQAMGSIHVGGGGPAVTANEPAVAEGPGTVIGPYTLLEVIGEGGFGVVFRAEQGQPVRRTVALKVLKPGMDTRQVVARFEAERQALAIMDHPNIAKVFDGGATPSGRPYFVMELVKGVPITEYCDQNRLTPRQRLELFILVCQAVQHAHTKGVIHRDLKPSNILVGLYDGKPVPKVIDFGVAKAAGQPLTEKTLHTGFGAVVGTLEYMSPEQATLDNLDVDTRSDVYSLGVLLYELLTGTTPARHRRLKEMGLLEALRVIREEEAPTLSNRLSTTEEMAVATNRGTEPAKLVRLVRGELGWIVMTALEKDRTRRYESASGLAADVERYLADEPVLAGPPTAGYWLRKFARRHRLGLAVAGLVLFFLALLVGGAGWVVRDRTARQAVLDREVTQALDGAEEAYRRDRLPEALAELKQAESLLAGGGGREELWERARRWRADLDMAGRLEAIRLEQTVLSGDYYDHARADPAYDAAFRDYGIDVSGLPPAVAADLIRASVVRERLMAALDDWGWVRQGAGPRAQEPLWAIARLTDPDELRNRLRDPAIRGDRKALEALADRLEVAALPPATAVLLGRLLLRAGAAQKAYAVLAAAQQRHPADFWLNTELGGLLTWRLPRFADAAGYLRAGLAARPSEPATMVALAGALRKIGHSDQAMYLLRIAVDLKPDYADAYNGLGGVYTEQGAWEQAVLHFQRSLELNPAAANVHRNLGNAYEQRREWAKAVAAYEEAIRRGNDPIAYEKLLRLSASCPEPKWRDPARVLRLADEAVRRAPRNAAVWDSRASLHVQLRHPDQAIADFSRADQLRPGDAKRLVRLGYELQKVGRWDEALAVFQKALDLAPDDFWVAQDVANAHRLKKNYDQALTYYRQALAINPQAAQGHQGMAYVHMAKGELEEAEREYREAKRLGSTNLGCYLELAEVLERRKRPHEARAVYEEATRLQPTEAFEWYRRGLAQEKLGRHAEAAADFTRAVELEVRPNAIADYLIERAGAHLQAGRPREALGDCEKARDLTPDSAKANNELAWFLANSPEPSLRDPRRAVELAERAVKLAPRDGNCWNTLGAARYRAGDWPGAAAALAKAMELRRGGDAFDWFFLAMTHGQLGHADEARRWYDRAVAWTDKHHPDDAQLRRFRAEAAALLRTDPPNPPNPR